MRIDDADTAVEILESALEREEDRVRTLFILIDSLELVRRIVLFERRANWIKESECLALVAKELLFSLKTAAGVGPASYTQPVRFSRQLRWMVGDTNADCVE